MTTAITIFIGLTLFSTMLSLGLSLRAEELRRWADHPALPLRVLLGSCLLVPLLALLLLLSPWNQLLQPPDRFAIGLMALCPSAPLALRKARKAGGDHQLAALIQVGAALAAIVSVPLLAVLFRRSFGVEGWQVHPLDVALQVGKVQVLPLLLGVALRHWRHDLASRIEGPLNRIAGVSLLLLFALVLVLAARPLLSSVPTRLPALLMMAVLAVASLLIGAVMAGPGSPHGTSTTTALVTAMRNPGLALLFANRHGQELIGVKAGILMYVLATVLVSVPLMQRQRREGA
jgi:BASS family bile acid:Na+ symporter